MIRPALSCPTLFTYYVIILGGESGPWLSQLRKGWGCHPELSKRWLCSMFMLPKVLSPGESLENNVLFAGRPPANNFLFSGGPPASNFLFKCCKSCYFSVYLHVVNHAISTEIFLEKKTLPQRKNKIPLWLLLYYPGLLGGWVAPGNKLFII